MSVLYIVLPLALIVVLAAVFAYEWAAKHGQFDDLTTPAIRILHDEPATRPGAASEPGTPGESTAPATSNGEPG